MKITHKEEREKKESELEEEEKEESCKKISLNYSWHQEKLKELFLEMGLCMRSKT
jgi:hypothetical protein